MIQSKSGYISKTIEYKERFDPSIIKAQVEPSEIISWAHNRSCTRLYTLSIKSFKYQYHKSSSLFLDIYDFTLDKSTPLSSSIIIRMHQLKQQPQKSFLLANDNEDSVFLTKNLGQGDNTIQIQVSNFEERVVILNSKEKRLHLVSLDLIHSNI